VTDALRLPPLPPESWTEAEITAVKAGFPPKVVDSYLTGADAPPVPNVLGTLVHHPAVAGPLLAYNGALMASPILEKRLKELMVLRVAWRTRSAYEWAQHARLAYRYKITEEEIARIDLGAEADGWTPLEADLLRATDQLMDRYRIDDETWARLARELDKRQLMEAILVVGGYISLALLFNSLGIQVDPGAEPPIALPTTPDGEGP
jgi:4-carboxymuconolactone decarboxylase